MAISPSTAKSCSEFILEHRNEIINKVYDIQPRGWSTDELTRDEQIFLYQYCPASLQSLAQGKLTPIFIFDKLSIYDHYDFAKRSHIKTCLIKNPSVPRQIIEVLALDSDPRVDLYSTYPPLIYDIWSKSSDQGKRADVAFNRNTPISILETLSNDKESRVRVNVAKNPITPVNVIQKLANDENQEVQLSVHEIVMNSVRAHESPGMYSQESNLALSKDKELCIRILEKMSNTSDSHVKEKVKYSLKELKPGCLGLVLLLIAVNLLIVLPLLS